MHMHLQNDQTIRRASSLLLGDADVELGSAEKKDREGDGAYSPQQSVHNFGYVRQHFKHYNFSLLKRVLTFLYS